MAQKRWKWQKWLMKSKRCNKNPKNPSFLNMAMPNLITRIYLFVIKGADQGIG